MIEGGEMNKELARIIIEIIADRLRLPVGLLQKMEKNLINGEFDKVLEEYKKKKTTFEKMYETKIDDNEEDTWFHPFRD